MNKKVYQHGRRYAEKLDPINFKDILHDAYIRWYDKCQKDLFDEKEGTVIRVIKNTWVTSKGPNRYMWRGQYYPKVYSSDFLDELLNYNDPESQMISKETLEKYIEKIDKFDFTKRLVYRYSLLGYKGVEIENLTNISRQLISYHLNRPN